MNEPANFDTNKNKPWNWPDNRPEWNLKCPNNKYDGNYNCKSKSKFHANNSFVYLDPPYLPIIARAEDSSYRISDKTICMRAKQGNPNNEYMHYDVHNLYGWSQSKPTLE